jgi:hypothetical protein
LHKNKFTGKQGFFKVGLVEIASLMKVTFDIPRSTKNALEDLKTRLRRKGLPAFEWSIVEFLVAQARDRDLERHFKAIDVARKAAKLGKRRRRGTARGSGESRH